MALAACVTWTDGERGGLTLRSASGPTGLDGSWVAEVPVDEGTTSFLLTIEADDDVLVYARTLVDPSGATVVHAPDWWDMDENLSNGLFASRVSSFQWPIRDVDGPLTPGTWRVALQADVASSPVAVDVALGDDASFDDGTLRIVVAYTGALFEDAEVRAGVADALQIWADDLATPLGITLEATEVAVDAPSTLASPGFGDREIYEGLVADLPEGAVPIVLVEQIRGGVNVFGVAGGIPGPLVPTDRSAVTLSVLEGAGADRAFSASERSLLAETMAHEVGHYLGLFHPVELPADASITGTVDRFDALDDTPRCARFGACLDVLADNLMFPTPVCAQGIGTSCASWVRQTSVTSAQRGVLHRATLLR